MLHYAVLPIPAALASATANIYKLKGAPLAGSITRVEVKTDAPNGAGAALFDVKINGVSAFASDAHRPGLASGASSGYSATIDSPAVARGDAITIDALSVPAGGFAAGAVEIHVEIDDGIATAPAGDVTGSFAASVVARIRGNLVAAGALLHGQSYAFSMFLAQLVARYHPLTHDDLINDLYRGSLARDPSASELSASRTNFLAGIDSSGVAGLLAQVQSLGHSLFTGTAYGLLARSDADFVTDLYHAYLGREPSSSESATWLATLSGSTRAAVDTSFSAAPEVSTIRLRRAVSSSNRGANPMTAAGDIIIGGAGGAETRLGKPSSSNYLGTDALGNFGYNPLPSAGASAPEPFASLHPDIAPGVANAIDDEFTGAALASKWAWANQKTTTTAFGNSHLSLVATTGAGFHDHRIIYQAFSAAAFKVRAKCMALYRNANANTSVGLYVGDAAGQWIFIGANFVNSTVHMLVRALTDVNTVSVDYWTSDNPSRGVPLYFEIEENAANRIYRVSLSGANGSFMQFYSHGKTTFLTTARVGLGFNVNGNVDQAIASFDWIRRVS